jgi:hypothetical protein
MPAEVPEAQQAQNTVLFQPIFVDEQGGKSPRTSSLLWILE